MRSQDVDLASNLLLLILVIVPFVYVCACVHLRMLFLCKKRTGTRLDQSFSALGGGGAAYMTYLCLAQQRGELKQMGMHD